MESKPYLRVFTPSDFLEFPKSTFVELEEQQQDHVFENKSLQKHIVQEQELLESKPLEGEFLESKPGPLESELLQQQPIVQEVFLDNDMLLRQLQFLSRPFQQKVYQPLIIVMKNGEQFSGKIEALEQSTVHINGDQQLTIDGNDIEEILWQNKPFPRM